jgi:hypothetical protein
MRPKTCKRCGICQGFRYFREDLCLKCDGILKDLGLDFHEEKAKHQKLGIAPARPRAEGDMLQGTDCGPEVEG